MARARLEQLRKKGKTAAALHRTRHPRVSRLG
jgi:hypothetical protein